MIRVLFLVLLSFGIFASEIKYDILYLINYAQDNPTDIKSRELLLKHFYEKDDKKMTLKYANELFNLDKKNKLLLKVLAEYDIKIRKKKIETVLKEFVEKKEFIRYINLYKALIGTNHKLKSDAHIDAIYCAIKSENFKLAKNILKRDDLPMSPKLSSIMKILDKKLHSDTSL